MRSIDRYTEDYLKSDFEDVQVKYRKRKIIEILNQYKPARILEVGCGTKPLFIDYTHFTEYTIVEPSPEFYRIALTKAKNIKDIRVLNTFFEDALPELSSSTFDFIILSGLLHEVENPDVILETAARLCSPKTVLHANVPNARSFHRLLAFESGLIDSIYEHSENNIRLQQNTVFDSESFRLLFVRHGFNIINAGSYFVKPFSHKQMLEMICQGIVSDKILDGFYKMSLYLPDMGSEIFINCSLASR